MKNIIIDNLLTKDNIITIKKIIDTEINKKDIWEKTYIEYSSKGKEEYLEKKDKTIAIKRLDFARIDLYNLQIPEDIINKISKKLIENNLSGYRYCGSSTAWLYNKNLGNPKLTDHIDHTEDENTIMVDYQLDSNTDWPICVENKNYTLSNNQALIFCGKKQRHSRPFKKFNDREFVTNIMFRFNLNENVYL
jgi:hypothetical protein